MRSVVTGYALDSVGARGLPTEIYASQISDPVQLQLSDPVQLQLSDPVQLQLSDPVQFSCQYTKITLAATVVCVSASVPRLVRIGWFALS